MKLVIEDYIPEKFVFFYYKDGSSVPVSFERCNQNTPTAAMAYVANKRFSKLSGKMGEKIKKFYDLGVTYVVLTDAITGRVLYKKPIEENLKRFAHPRVYDAWISDFENIRF